MALTRTPEAILAEYQHHSNGPGHVVCMLCRELIAAQERAAVLENELRNNSAWMRVLLEEAKEQHNHAFVGLLLSRIALSEAALRNHAGALEVIKRQAKAEALRELIDTCHNYPWTAYATAIAMREQLDEKEPQR